MAQSFSVEEEAPRPGGSGAPLTDGNGDESEEFENSRVPDHKLQENYTFASIFAGRHTAAPELVIGPQFVRGGATFGNMVMGCLIGNLLAVLAWRYICAQIAVTDRFSTYYTIKRILGNHMLAIYNILVALVLGAIAGFMFILAADAVALAIGLEVDEEAFVVTDPGLLLLTVLTGAFTTVVAMFGMRVVTIVSYWLTPPMFAIIAYLLYAAFDDLGIGFGNFIDKMSNQIYTGSVSPGHTGAVFDGMVPVMIAAFAQDQFCHVGLIDLTMLRFGKTANCGWQSAWGMYLGHLILWIGAGVLYRSQAEYDGFDSASLKPAQMALRLAWYPGVLAILFASWSTANPFLYAGGLGLKSCFAIFGQDQVSARVVTGAMGVIATVVACFPGILGFFMFFIQFSGAFLVPVGSIIVADTFMLPMMNKQRDFSFNSNPDCWTANIEGAITWGVTTSLIMVLHLGLDMPISYSPLIQFPLAIGIYAALCNHRRPNVQ